MNIWAILIFWVRYIFSWGSLKSYGDAVDTSLYGQEKNLGMWAIYKINMIWHNFKESIFQKRDTLCSRKYPENGELMKVDRVVVNPP